MIKSKIVPEFFLGEEEEGGTQRAEAAEVPLRFIDRLQGGGNEQAFNYQAAF